VTPLALSSSKPACSSLVLEVRGLTSGRASSHGGKSRETIFLQNGTKSGETMVAVWGVCLLGVL
jgi:hypothetical protein